LISAATSETITNAMMAATDALYYAIKALGPTILNEPDPEPRTIMPGALETVIYGQPTSGPPTPTASPLPTVTTSTVHTIRRLIRRGGTALLVGPTGVGKTYAVKQAVLAECARLVVVKGRPGLDDRQLYGGIYPTEEHYRWIDGPLAKAWRAAHAGERVVLVIDELARLDPYHLAALIGALDPVTGTEVQSMHISIDVDEQQWYYVLSLPNGDDLVAPCPHLSVLATTNLGSDYAQLQTTFDAALLRRFALHLDIEGLPSDVQRDILVYEQHVPANVAMVLVASAEFSSNATAANGGLLQRELNLGTLINWAIEAQALVMEGASWSTAVRDTAEITAIPFACPRLADGRLEAPAAQMLREHIATLIRDHHLS
jgi:nitric oxide reductase NorQ protein